MNKKPSFYVALIASICIVGVTAPQAFADANTCKEAVEQKHFERLSTACINLPHRDRLKKMRLMMSGDFSHYLGTVEKPTNAFVMLREMAEANDSKAQYMYGHLYSTVHIASEKNWPNHIANKGRLSVTQYNDNIRAEATSWLMKAAEGGHSIAMLEIAGSELLHSYTQRDIDLESALQIAANAQTNNPVLAEDLMQRIRKRIKELK